MNRRSPLAVAATFCHLVQSVTGRPGGCVFPEMGESRNSWMAKKGELGYPHDLGNLLLLLISAFKLKPQIHLAAWDGATFGQ